MGRSRRRDREHASLFCRISVGQERWHLREHERPEPAEDTAASERPGGGQERQCSGASAAVLAGQREPHAQAPVLEQRESGSLSAHTTLAQQERQRCDYVRPRVEPQAQSFFVHSARVPPK